MTPAAAGETYAATCSQQTWTGKDPRACKGIYSLYEITANRPKLILQVNRMDDTSWEQLGKGRRRAEEWCKDNPLSCSVISAVGVQVAWGLVAAAMS